MSDQCNDDVFKYGESVGLVNMSKEDCEAHCKKLTEESEYIYDWHYSMGRQHVMRLKKGFQKELRYTVFKNKDLEAIELTSVEAAALLTVARKIEAHRAAQGKKPIEGVFIESDWKCHDAAWKLVRQEWESKQ
jgi:hypothetical protein